MINKCVFCQEVGVPIHVDCIDSFKKILRLQDKLDIPYSVEDINALELIKLLKRASKEA